MRARTATALIRTACFVLMLVPGVARAEQWYVRQDGTGDYETVDAAVKLASAGDEIFVGPGLYATNAEIQVPLTIQSERSTEPAVLSGEGLHRILRIELPDADSKVVIRNLSFVDGYQPNVGGAIFCIADGEIVIEDCEFIGNRTDFGAGAIHARFGARLHVSRCHFEKNYATVGGGASTIIVDAAAIFEDCTFHENGTGGIGGAIATDECSIEVRRSYFRGNWSTSLSGAINLNQSSALITDSTFQDNRSSSRGTISLEWSSELDLSRCILSGDSGGAGLYPSWETIRSECNIFWNNFDGPMQPDLDGIDPELVVDPRICATNQRRPTLANDSPALAGTLDCSGPIGGLEGGCEFSPGTLSLSLADVEVDEELERISMRFVAVGGTGLAAVSGLDFSLSWDPTVLALESSEAGEAAGAWSIAQNQEVAGRLRVSMATLPGVDMGIDAAELLDLRFAILEPAGRDWIDFLEPLAFGEDGEPLPVHARPLGGAATCGSADLNRDLAVNSADAVLALRLAAGLDEPTNWLSCAADLNENGEVDAGDAVLILRRAVGLDKASLDEAVEARVVFTGSDDRIELTVWNAAGIQLLVQLPQDADLSDLASGPGLLAHVQNDRAIDVALASTEAPSGGLHIEMRGKGLGDAELAWLRPFASDGSELNYRIVGAGEGDGPPSLDVAVRIVPNPFNPRTEIRFRMPLAGLASAKIFDSFGRLVWESAPAEFGAGEQTIPWSGVDAQGRALASGNYFVKVKTPSSIQAARAVLLK